MESVASESSRGHTPWGTQRGAKMRPLVKSDNFGCSYCKYLVFPNGSYNFCEYGHFLCDECLAESPMECDLDHPTAKSDGVEVVKLYKWNYPAYKLLVQAGLYDCANHGCGQKLPVIELEKHVKHECAFRKEDLCWFSGCLESAGTDYLGHYKDFHQIKVFDGQHANIGVLYDRPEKYNLSPKLQWISSIMHCYDSDFGLAIVEREGKLALGVQAYVSNQKQCQFRAKITVILNNKEPKTKEILVSNGSCTFDDGDDERVLVLSLEELEASLEYAEDLRYFKCSVLIQEILQLPPTIPTCSEGKQRLPPGADSHPDVVFQAMQVRRVEDADTCAADQDDIANKKEAISEVPRSLTEPNTPEEGMPRAETAVVDSSFQKMPPTSVIATEGRDSDESKTCAEFPLGEEVLPTPGLAGVLPITLPLTTPLGTDEEVPASTKDDTSCEEPKVGEEAVELELPVISLPSGSASQVVPSELEEGEDQSHLKSEELEEKEHVDSTCLSGSSFVEADRNEAAATTGTKHSDGLSLSINEATASTEIALSCPGDSVAESEFPPQKESTEQSSSVPAEPVEAEDDVSNSMGLQPQAAEVTVTHDSEVNTVASSCGNSGDSGSDDAEQIVIVVKDAKFRISSTSSSSSPAAESPQTAAPEEVAGVEETAEDAAILPDTLLKTSGSPVTSAMIASSAAPARDTPAPGQDSEELIEDNASASSLPTEVSQSAVEMEEEAPEGKDAGEPIVQKMLSSASEENREESGVYLEALPVTSANECNVQADDVSELSKSVDQSFVAGSPEAKEIPSTSAPSSDKAQENILPVNETSGPAAVSAELLAVDEQPQDTQETPTGQNVTFKEGSCSEISACVLSPSGDMPQLCELQDVAEQQLAHTSDQKPSVISAFKQMLTAAGSIVRRAVGHPVPSAQDNKDEPERLEEASDESSDKKLMPCCCSSELDTVGEVNEVPGLLKSESPESSARTSDSEKSETKKVALAEPKEEVELPAAPQDSNSSAMEESVSEDFLRSIRDMVVLHERCCECSSSSAQAQHGLSPEAAKLNAMETPTTESLTAIDTEATSSASESDPAQVSEKTEKQIAGDQMSLP